jgi:hypothetical protein
LHAAPTLELKRDFSADVVKPVFELQPSASQNTKEDSMKVKERCSMFGRMIRAIAIVALASVVPHAAAQTTEPRNLDDMLAEVGDRVPAFGGLFIGANGRLVVYLTDPAQAGAAKQVIAEVFGQDVVKSGMQVLQGRYRFSQLGEWYSLAHRLIEQIKDMRMLDIDEGYNRLAVGVAKKEATSQVEQMLFQLGIPREAVFIEVDESIPATHTLQNTVGNQGGLQIFSVIAGIPTWICTRAFSAIDLTYSRAGFVTNSHCTSPSGVVDGVMGGAVFFEPTFPGARAGVEVTDPPISLRCDGYGGGVLTVACRLSDSAFVRYDDGVRALGVGYIARPTSQTIAAPVLTISHTASPFRITAKATATLSGATLNKVGRTTGWTSGTVGTTCAQIKQLGGPWLRCQYRVRTAAFPPLTIGAPGDSGSPVFAITSASGDVTLHGLLWGGNRDRTKFVFSPINSVESELGPLQVCAIPFRC